MSTSTPPRDADAAAANGTGSNDSRLRQRLGAPRSLALAGLGTMTAGYLATLYWLTTVVGGAVWLASAVAVGLGAGVLLSGVRERTMVGIAALGAVVAGGLYYASASPVVGVGSVFHAIGDGLVMLSGVSVLELDGADVWIALLVPVPVFLTSYFGVRGRYVLATIAGGWLVLFLAITGDATVPETLLGTIGAFAAIGFGELERRGASVDGANALVVLIAVMAVLAVTVPLVPSGSASSLDPAGFGPGDGAGSGSGDSTATTPLDQQLIGGDSVRAGGPINLSTDVRFVVESPTKLRWRTGSLGTYSGTAWYRSGASMPYVDSLPTPQGETQTVEQTYDLRAPATAVPAASYPVSVEGLQFGALQRTTTATISTNGQIDEGTTYSVESQVPDPTVETLQTAGTDYPGSIETRYTKLPEDTVPDRVHEITDQITSEASTPYERARAIEAYLESEKEYSQNVQAPSGTLADGFLFEMNAGYCTYFAGTMATMLRTQGIPTRVAVGYSSGQYAGNDTWVVRGSDAHAWVEVYFPDVGWIEFDPTPGSAVDSARRNAIESARDDNASNVDVPESSGEPIRFDAPADSSSEESGGSNGSGSTAPDGGQSDGGESGAPEGIRARYYSDSGNETVAYVQPELGNISTPETSGTNATGTNGSLGVRPTDGSVGGLEAGILGLLVVAGTVAWGRQIGARRRLWRAGSVHWQRRTGPEADAERAIERLETYLGEQYRPRGSGETHREFRQRLPASVDPAVERAFDMHERIRYGGEVDRERVDELIETVDDVVRDDLPVLGRLPRR